MLGRADELPYTPALSGGAVGYPGTRLKPRLAGAALRFWPSLFKSADPELRPDEKIREWRGVKLRSAQRVQVADGKCIGRLVETEPNVWYVLSPEGKLLREEPFVAVAIGPVTKENPQGSIIPMGRKTAWTFLVRSVGPDAFAAKPVAGARHHGGMK